MSDRIRACTRCADLVASRRSVVPGTRPPGARLLLVGEAPGASEDEQGAPFVGRSGQLLDGFLAAAGLDRAHVAVVNVLKCRPPGNRAPRRAEVANCRPWLKAQIALASPDVIVSLGRSAATEFLGAGARISQARLDLHSYDGRPLVVTYHPSAALRFGPAGAPALALGEDLLRAAGLLGARPRPRPDRPVIPAPAAPALTPPAAPVPRRG